jgi:predicted nucleic acid-binding protein
VITPDASVLISALVAADVNHLSTRAWLTRRLRDGTHLVAPSLLLAEVGGVFYRQSGSRVATRRVLRFILALPRFRLLEIDGRLARRTMLLAATIGLRGADAVYVAVARQQGARLITWDADQHRRANLIITARTPLTDSP